MEALIAILIPLLIQIESGGRVDAIGDNGLAVGILQLHEIYVQDVNRIWGTEYTPQDRYNARKSAEITILYLWYWGKHYERTTGNRATLEVLAKIHNGGCYGYKKKATEKYWEKVERVYNGHRQAQ